MKHSLSLDEIDKDIFFISPLSENIDHSREKEYTQRKAHYIRKDIFGNPVFQRKSVKEPKEYRPCRHHTEPESIDIKKRSDTQSGKHILALERGK